MRSEAEILRAQQLIYAALEGLESDTDSEARGALEIANQAYGIAVCDTLSWVLGQGARFQSLIEGLEPIPEETSPQAP